jgi:hypothetical protein
MFGSLKHSSEDWKTFSSKRIMSRLQRISFDRLNHNMLQFLNNIDEDMVFPNPGFFFAISHEGNCLPPVARELYFGLTWGQVGIHEGPGSGVGVSKSKTSLRVKPTSNGPILQYDLLTFHGCVIIPASTLKCRGFLPSVRYCQVPNPQVKGQIASLLKKKKKSHHFSHIRLIRRPINNKGWNSCISC